MHRKAYKLLENMHKLRRIPSALIFFGKEGIGKKDTAFEFSKAILCLKNTFPACGECPSCMRMEEFKKKPEEELEVYGESQTGKEVFLYLQGDHPDFIYVKPEKDEIKIDQIRGVREFVSLKPALSSKKVVLIAPADSMNTYAQNAFLKTLEEPPEDTHIIMVSHSLEKLLPTVKSRSFLIEFEELSEEELRRLSGVDDPLILSLAEGSVNKAKSLAQKRELVSMAERLFKASPLDAYKIAQSLDEMEYEDQKLFLHLVEVILHKKALEDKERYELYEKLIDRTLLVLDNLRRGLKLSLFVFYVINSLSEVRNSW